MSNQAQDPSADALQTLTREVYLPAFVEKCASAGIHFPDEESLNAALESVAMLKAAEQEETTSLAKQARADLGAMLGETEKSASDAENEKAASLARNDKIRSALAALAAK